MDTCEANSTPILQKVRDKMVDRTMWQQGTCLHVMAPLGVSFHLLIQDQGLVLSTIFGPI